MRCLTSTCRVVSALPSLNDGKQRRDRRVPRELPFVDQRREEQRRHRLGVRRDHEERVAVDRGRFAELAGAEPAGEDDLAVLDQPDGDAGHAERHAASLDERANLGHALVVERVRLPAGERLALIALREQAIEDERHLRETLLRGGLGHVLDDDGPDVAAAHGGRGHIAPFVRRRLVGIPLPIGPAVAVGRGRGHLERPLRVRLVRRPCRLHRGIRVGSPHVDEGDVRVGFGRLEDRRCASDVDGPPGWRDERRTEDGRARRVRREPLRLRANSQRGNERTGEGEFTDDFLKLLENSFARDWRKPRTWPWTRVAWAYGFALVGVTSVVGMSLLISALSASPPARAPAVLVVTSQQFRVSRVTPQSNRQSQMLVTSSLTSWHDRGVHE